MIAGFTMLLAKIAAVLTWIGQLFVKCWIALWDWVRDAFCWPFEQAMKIIKSTLDGIDVSSMEGYAASASSLPAEIMNILSLLHVGTCIAIIAAAIVIRFILQLVPFTRLGS